MKRVLRSALLFSSLFLVACGDTPDATSEKEKSKNVDSSLVENEPLEDKTYFFSGLINRKYSLRMKLVVSGDKASGSYFYASQKKVLELSGSVADGKLELDESIKGKVTGHFSGEMFGADSVIGVWKSPKGKEMPFVLFSHNEDSYVSELNEKGFSKWDIEEVRAFAKKFKEVKLPFEYAPTHEDAEDAGRFTKDETFKFWLDEYDIENDFMYTLYYGVVFYTDKYIGLVFTEDYHPGAFGINNQSMILLTITYTGDFIDSEFLGCHCFDTNMGSNDYYESSETFKFTATEITVDAVHTHATLYEDAESEVEPFEEITNETRVIKISAEGLIGN